MTDEEIAAHQDRRPRYAVGDCVEVDSSASIYHHARGYVVRLSAMQTIGGVVITYLYWLEMDNLARMPWMEENLRSVANATEPR